MKALKSFIGFVSPLLIFIFASCGNTVSDSGGGGLLSLELTDAATYQYDAVYVTIEEVQVHICGNENEGSNWEVVASLGKTYNLLDLRNGVRNIRQSINFQFTSNLRSQPWRQRKKVGC